MQRILALAAALAALLVIPSAASAAGGMRLAPVHGVTFDGPVWAGGAPGSGATYFVVEQRGLVWAVRGRSKRAFLDVRPRVLHGGEQGLLSLAFAADYATSGTVYAYFVGRDGDGQVRRFRVRGGRVPAGSAGSLVLRVPLSPPDATNHNGGTLWALPGGDLLLSVGDGGGGGVERRNSQRLGVLMGKLLRITPRTTGAGYSIPTTNPFRSRAGARKEIYALGLRNPWRVSVDAPTGDIWIGDVGQGAQEEVDVLRRGRPAGANFGWPRMEGTALFSDEVRLTAGRSVRPLVTYSHAGGRCSITGGVVYRGPVTAMRGRYLYADWCGSGVWSVRARDGGGRRTHAGVPGIVHFGAIAGGNVLAVSNRTGRLYRVVAG
jgi:glucose/arabinose dehydrogenase